MSRTYLAFGGGALCGVVMVVGAAWLMALQPPDRAHLTIFQSQHIPRSVSSFGSLHIGDPAPLKPGDGVAYPLRYVMESDFYVFAMDKNLDVGCTYGYCGMTGILVECMEGWLSGEDAQPELAERFGLTYEDVRTGRATMIVVADSDLRVVGIYPNSTMRDLHRILKKHRDLPKPPELLDQCLSYHMPR